MHHKQLVPTSPRSSRIPADTQETTEKDRSKLTQLKNAKRRNRWGCVYIDEDSDEEKLDGTFYHIASPQPEPDVPEKHETSMELPIRPYSSLSQAASTSAGVVNHGLQGFTEQLSILDTPNLSEGTKKRLNDLRQFYESSKDSKQSEITTEQRISVIRNMYGLPEQRQSAVASLLSVGNGCGTEQQPTNARESPEQRLDALGKLYGPSDPSKGFSSLYRRLKQRSKGISGLAATTQQQSDPIATGKSQHHPSRLSSQSFKEVRTTASPLSFHSKHIGSMPNIYATNNYPPRAFSPMPSDYPGLQRPLPDGRQYFAEENEKILMNMANVCAEYNVPFRHHLNQNQPTGGLGGVSHEQPIYGKIRQPANNIGLTSEQNGTIHSLSQHPFSLLPPQLRGYPILFVGVPMQQHHAILPVGDHQFGFGYVKQEQGRNHQPGPVGPFATSTPTVTHGYHMPQSMPFQQTVPQVVKSTGQSVPLQQTLPRAKSNWTSGQQRLTRAQSNWTLPSTGQSAPSQKRLSRAQSHWTLPRAPLQSISEAVPALSTQFEAGETSRGEIARYYHFKEDSEKINNHAPFLSNLKGDLKNVWEDSEEMYATVGIKLKNLGITPAPTTQMLRCETNL